VKCVPAPQTGKYCEDARHHHPISVSTAILDIDGTLVDTNYHHTIAWARAFGRFDIDIALWRIHRHIGMGGDQVVTSLCGEEVEDEHGDEIRSAEKQEYEQLIDEVRLMEGARDLIVELKRRGHTVVLASSAKEDEVDHYLDLLDAREIADGWTTSADVESTKPAPDLVQAALDRVDAAADSAVMIGDTPWDVKAALEAGVETITVVTGGFSEQQLTEAGAVAVFESVAELLERLDETRLK
jgi:HAD superfamily hydrolase (TIGR01509 family)